MKRSKPIARSTKPIKRGRVKPRNDTRRAKNHERAYGGTDRVEWVKSLPCVVSECVRATENVHVVTGGTGRKSDARFIVAMCHEHHRALHQYGLHEFEQWYLPDSRFNLLEIAANTEAAWQALVPVVENTSREN